MIISSKVDQCPYFDQQISYNIICSAIENSETYEWLADNGFFRYDNSLHSQKCVDCYQCVPVRVDVANFKRNRSQQRIWRKNQDLQIITAKGYTAEHVDLFQDYIIKRHQADTLYAKKYAKKLALSSFNSNWSKTILHEFRKEEQIIALVIVDFLNNGLYTLISAYNQCFMNRSLGVFAILFEIEEAKRLGKKYVYLGNWIKDYNKMNYKNKYQPLEYFYQGNWHKSHTIKVINNE